MKGQTVPSGGPLTTVLDVLASSPVAACQAPLSAYVVTVAATALALLYGFRLLRPGVVFDVAALGAALSRDELKLPCWPGSGEAEKGLLMR